MLSPAAGSPWLLSVGLTLIALAGAGLIGWALGRGRWRNGCFACGLCASWAGTAMGFMSITLSGPRLGLRGREVTGILHSGVMAGVLTTLLNFGLTFLVAKLSYDWFEVRWLRLKVRFAYDAETGERLGSLAAN